jgi:hypothetical protein
MADEDLWRRRFYAFTAVRLFGLATFFAGVAIAYTDVAREGGWPFVGAIVAIMGAVDALLAPRMLKMLWARQDEQDR